MYSRGVVLGHPQLRRKAFPFNVDPQSMSAKNLILSVRGPFYTSESDVYRCRRIKTVPKLKGLKNVGSSFRISWVHVVTTDRVLQ